MIDGRIITEHLRGGGKSPLVIHAFAGIKNVLLVLVLDMNEGIGSSDTAGEGGCRDTLCLRAGIGMGSRCEITCANLAAREHGIVIDRPRKADTISTGRGAKNS